MTDTVVTFSEELLKLLYEECPEKGEITVTWKTDAFTGEVRPFKVEREFRLVPYEVE